MTEAIKWAELNAFARDRLIHEHVMAGTPGICEHKRGEFLMACPECHASWPINEPHRTSIHDTVPPYTTSWDAAMLAYSQAMRHADKEVLIHELLGIPYAIESQYDLNVLPSKHYLNVSRVLDLIRDWTPDRLCISILRACGVEVEL